MLSDPLISSLPNAIDRKGRAPSQLQASIFSYLRSHCHQMQSTERKGPQLASSIDILQPLIASSPNTVDRKGRAPSQLQASMFSDLRSHCHQMQSTEREGPPVSFEHRYFPTFDCITNKRNRQKGEGPSQLQASIFSDLRSRCHQMQLTEREGPPVSFEHRYSPTFDCITTKHNRQKGEGPSKLQAQYSSTL